MLLFDGAFGVFFLALWLFCIFDVITTPEYAVRSMPKLVWLLIVIVLPDVGSILWLVAGHPWQSRAPRDLPYKGNTGRSAVPSTRPARASNPDDDETYIAGLRARVEEQRRRAREAGGDGPGPTTAA